MLWLTIAKPTTAFNHLFRIFREIHSNPMCFRSVFSWLAYGQTVSVNFVRVASADAGTFGRDGGHLDDFFEFDSRMQKKQPENIPNRNLYTACHADTSFSPGYFHFTQSVCHIIRIGGTWLQSRWMFYRSVFSSKQLYHRKFHKCMCCRLRQA